MVKYILCYRGFSSFLYWFLGALELNHARSVAEMNHYYPKATSLSADWQKDNSVWIK